MTKNKKTTIQNSPLGKTAAMKKHLEENPQIVEAWKNIDWIAANAPVSYDKLLKGKDDEKK